jgi:hypothetical protein
MAAVRQKFHLARCSNLPSHLYKASRVSVVIAVGALILAAAAYFTGLLGGHPKLAGEPASAKVYEANASRSQLARIRRIA